MSRLKLSCVLAASVGLSTGCRAPDDGFAFAEVSSGTTGPTTLPDPTDEESESESGTETGDEVPEDFEGLRFVVAASNPAIMISVDLDDPEVIPPPETIWQGEAYAGVFDATPWGSRVVTRDGLVDQLIIDGAGAYSFEEFSAVPGEWLDSIWFDDTGTNAMMSLSAAPAQAPNQLLWLRFSGEELNTTLNITPPVGEGGVVNTLGRTPDDVTAIVLVDSEPDDVWQMYHLPLLPEIGMSEQINQATLPGVPGQNVPAFLWMHLDDSRVAFRKQVGDVLRPSAVPINDPNLAPVDLAPSLPQAVSSMVWSDASDAFLLASGGSGELRDLHLLLMASAITTLDPLEITTPEQLALSVVRPPLGTLNQGHGWDSMGRIFYAYSTNGMTAEGIQLITIAANNIAGRQDIANIPPAVDIDMMAYDPLTQMLGFRVLSSGSSWISYIDMSEQNPQGIRVDQFFDHNEMTPNDFAGFAFAPDRSVIAVAGSQSGEPVLFTSEIGDDLGETSQILLPPQVEQAGVDVENTPLFSPESQSILLWYSTVNNRRGLLQAPTNGARPFEIVINLEYDLRTGGFMGPGLISGGGAGAGDGDGDP